MKKLLEIIKKRYYIICIFVLYNIVSYYSVFYNREVLKIQIEQFTEIPFIKKILFAEAHRLIFIAIISIVFISIIYYLLLVGIQGEKNSIVKHIKNYFIYLILTICTGVLWVPIYIILIFLIFIILTPSIAIAVPLFLGKEELFIPAIGLWIITFILLAFSLLIFSLFMNLWYIEIFLKTKNIFSAFFSANDFVKIHFLRLLPLGVGFVIGSALFFATIYKGFRILYIGGVPLQSPIVLIGLIISGIIYSVLNIYTFVYVEKEYKETEEPYELVEEKK